MAREEKNFAYNKAQGYKNDALFWNDKANDHYKNTSNLLTTISITTLGFITIFFPEKTILTEMERILFFVIIAFSVISVLAALWQGYVDQVFFVHLSADASKRQSLWEDDKLSESEKEKEIAKLRPTAYSSKTTGINIQMFCLVIIVICLLFLGLSKLFIRQNLYLRSNIKHNKYYKDNFKLKGNDNKFRF